MPFGKGGFQTAVGLRTIRLNDSSVSRSAVLAALDRIWISGSGNLPVARRPMAERRIRPGFLPEFSSTGSVWMPRGRLDPYAYRSPPDTRAMCGFPPFGATRCGPRGLANERDGEAVPLCHCPIFVLSVSDDDRTAGIPLVLGLCVSLNPVAHNGGGFIRDVRKVCVPVVQHARHDAIQLHSISRTPPGFSHTRDSMERGARSCWQR